MWSVGFLQRIPLSMASLFAGCLLFASVVEAGQAANPRLAPMIKKAAQEGEIVYQGPDPATGLSVADMAREMQALTEKQFGVKIRIKVDNALSFPASTAKALAEIKAGAPPSFDLMIQTPVSGAPLAKAQALEAVPWLDLFPHIKQEDLELNGVAIVQTTLFVQPAYNTRVVKPLDVPKTWEDILAPKWKNKLGMLIYPDPWAFLSQPDAWGQERTLSYLKKLMELNPKLGRFPEVHERVVSGETPLTWGEFRETALYAKQGGAPADVADRVEPALLWIYVSMVPKGARHPNAAALVAAAMLTEEGQNLQQKYQNTTSAFRPNTPAARFGMQRKFLRPDVDFQLKMKDELYKKINAIMIKK